MRDTAVSSADTTAVRADTANGKEYSLAMRPDWETCAEGDCDGVRLSSGKCLTHADKEETDAALKRFRENGIIDARGVQVSAELLRRIRDAAPRDEQNPDRPYFDRARFDRAIFGDGANFINVTFGSGAKFVGATFGNEARFINATFGFGAEFDDATFGSTARFMGATLGDGAKFDRATFGDWATFAEARFGSLVRFVGTRFGRGAGFVGTTFGDRAVFVGVTFGSGARFGAATFGDRALLGPLAVKGGLSLEEAVFAHGPTLRMSAARLDLRDMRLPDGALIELRWAAVWLDGTYFGRPTVLAGVSAFPRLGEGPPSPSVERSWRTDRPRVMSLRGSDVANLVLANVDLRACRFSGVHHLDQLRLEATIDFPDPPPGLRAGWTLPPLWRWTRRNTLAEEHRWRRSRPKHAGWYPRACRVRGLAKREGSLRPTDIALLYRALRKSREDAKDEPGAADFYYGEMEMRRHAARRFSPEWGLLTLYWLVSGYALRAWRAFAALLLVIVVAAGIFATVGFKPPEARRFVPVRVGSTGALVYQEQPVKRPSSGDQFPGTLGYSAEVATSLLRAAERPVTAAGEWTQAILRWLGPLLFGLAVFSLRGRVKR